LRDYVSKHAQSFASYHDSTTNIQEGTSGRIFKTRAENDKKYWSCDLMLMVCSSAITLL